jgi:hypothetical protein
MYHSDKASVVGFEVLTMVLLKIQVFWNVTLNHWVSSSCGFEVTHAFTCMGQAAQEFLPGLLDPEDRGITILLNVKIHSPSNRVISHKIFILKVPVITATVIQSHFVYCLIRIQN